MNLLPIAMYRVILVLSAVAFVATGCGDDASAGSGGGGGGQDSGAADGGGTHESGSAGTEGSAGTQSGAAGTQGAGAGKGGAAGTTSEDTDELDAGASTTDAAPTPTVCADGEQDNDGNGECTADCSDVACVNGECSDASGTAACVCTALYEGELCDTLKPPSKAGLVLWLDATQAATLTRSNKNVVRWTNAADGNTFFEQPVANSQPIYNAVGLNGRPALRFINDHMTLSGFKGLNGATSYRVFAVLDSFNDTESGVILAGVNGEDGTVGFGQHGLLVSTNATATGLRLTHRMPFGVSGGLDLVTPAVLNLGNISLLRFAVNATGASGSSAIDVNGALSASKNGTADAFDRDLNLSIGRLSPTTDSRYLDGFVGEILVYAADQTEAETEAVTGYLRAHWGLIQ